MTWHIWQLWAPNLLVIYFSSRTWHGEPMDVVCDRNLLGFASRKFWYVFPRLLIQSFEIAVVRAISAVPMHASCGVIMGYYFGQYVFSGDRMMLLKTLPFQSFSMVHITFSATTLSV